MSMGNTPNKSKNEKENPPVENPAHFGGGAYPPPAAGGAYPPPPAGPPPAYSLDGHTTSASAPAYWVMKTLRKLALT